MNDPEKLFRKISGKERILLVSLVDDILTKKKGLNIKKLENSDFYRCRKGRFRIIFHHEKNNIIIDSIKLRRENTYKDLKWTSLNWKNI
ncbi:hypothetical protein C4572_02745 [Candidatus Parcubacteria bacterium]|nr:MAG: hypothetical protein C4572_02745 [Candidatus Parcubacteria bacterium]